MKFYTNARQYGNTILYIGYEDGERIQTKLEFEPTLYLEDPDKKSRITSYDGIPLKPFPQNSINEAKDFIKRYSDVENFQLYGMDKFAYQCIADMFPGEIEYSIDDMRIFSLDIEVYSGNGFPKPEEATQEITVITIKDFSKNKFYVFGRSDSPGGRYKPHLPNVEYFEYPNEIEMLNAFFAFWSMNHPDIVTGWYSRSYDIPYIINRGRKILGDKTVNKLSPWGRIQEKTSNLKRFGQYNEEVVYDIYGVNELDYLDLYKKYTYSNESSYKLGYISQKQLGITKLEFDGSLHELFMTDYQKYVEYNIQDTELIHLLDNKLKFLDLIIEVSYAGKVATFNDALGTVKYWEMLIYNHLNEKGQQPPIKVQGGSKGDQYQGAFVKDPVAGKHDWIMSFDLTSLYPSIIRQVNIGPETLVPVDSLTNELRQLLGSISVEKLINKEVDLSLLKEYDLSLSGNAKLYKKDDKSFLSELMEKFFNKRKEYKKLYVAADKAYEASKDKKDENRKVLYNVKQQAMKILINAAYGAVGNSFFQYYSLDNAEAVTVTGQVVIQWIEKRLNEYLNKLLGTQGIDRIVAIDTDSVYIVFDDLVNKVFPDKATHDRTKILNFLSKVSAEKIEPFIEKAYAELFDYMNNRDNLMDMKREVIADVAIWTGKKRYFMNVWDSEGVRYDKPKLKVMGIEVVKSSTPAVCRDKLEEALKICLTGTNDDLIKFINDFRKVFVKLLPQQVAFPRSVNDIQKWSSANGSAAKGTPIHVRGSINYNALLNKHNLVQRYDEIKEGDKVKFLYLLMPNMINENVLSFHDAIPKEFDLARYVDYDTQFEKTFLAPIETITNLIGWKTKKENNLAELFF